MKVHGEQLRRAKAEEWEIPHADSGRPEGLLTWFLLGRVMSSESEGGDPLRKIIKRYRQERDNFSEVEDIPLAELVGRLKVRKQRSEGVQETVVPPICNL